MKIIPTDAKTYDWSVLITTSDNLSVEIPVKVTVAKANNVATLSGITVKGVDAVAKTGEDAGDGTPDAPWEYTVNLTYAEANSDAPELIVDRDDTNANITLKDGDGKNALELLLPTM